MRQGLFPRSSAIAAVTNQTFAFEVGNGRQLDASGSMQAKVYAAGLAAFDHFPFGHRKLIKLQHPYFAQLLLNKFAK